MTTDPDSDNLNPDQDSLEYLLEEAHLFSLRKDYPKAIDILQNLLLRYPNNEEAQALWEEVRQKAHEDEVNKQSIPASRNYMPYRNSLGFFIWMGIAITFVIYSMVRNVWVISTAFHTGWTSPMHIVIDSYLGQYNPDSAFAEWTASAIVNYFIFTAIGGIGVLMAWAAIRELIRTPPWVDLQSKDYNPDSILAKNMWWWW